MKYLKFLIIILILNNCSFNTSSNMWKYNKNKEALLTNFDILDQNRVYIFQLGKDSIAAYKKIISLSLPSLEKLKLAFARKSQDFIDIVKIGSIFWN